MDHSSRQMVLPDQDRGTSGPTPWSSPSAGSPAGCVWLPGHFLAAIPSRKVKSHTRFEWIQALAQVCRCLAARPRPQAPGTEGRDPGRAVHARPAGYRLRSGAGGGAAEAEAAARGVRDRKRRGTDPPPRVDFDNLASRPGPEQNPGLRCRL